MGPVGDLTSIGEGEFPSFAFSITNAGADTFEFQEMHVTVDGGEPWGWGPFSLEPGQATLAHVYYGNMQRCMSEGTHDVALYVNGAPAAQATLVLTHSQDWGSRLPLPSDEEVAAANAAARCRSPYIFGQFDTSAIGSFSDFSIDFKADAAPLGTYCCLFQWAADLAALQTTFPDAHTESNAAGYGGLQVLSNGERVAIMSLWDVYYTDGSGAAQTLRARLVYPEASLDDGSFGGEGQGAHCLVPYDWQPGRWYRMRFSCSTSEQTGTICVDQRVCDLQSGTWTRLCCYDTGVAGACFTGPAFCFLENFDPTSCGDVRCMEVSDVCALSIEDGDWHEVTSAYLGPNGGEPTYSGSYAFGASGGTFWAVTSGVGGDWYGEGRGQAAGWYTAGA